MTGVAKLMLAHSFLLSRPLESAGEDKWNFLVKAVKVIKSKLKGD